MTAVLASVKAHVLLIIASLLIVTAVAIFDALPTSILALASVVHSFASICVWIALVTPFTYDNSVNDGYVAVSALMTFFALSNIASLLAVCQDIFTLLVVNQYTHKSIFLVAHK